MGPRVLLDRLPTVRPSLTTPRCRGLPILWALLSCIVVAEAIGELAHPSQLDVEYIFHDWLHDAAGVLCAIVCAARLLRNRDDRRAWGAITAGLVTFSSGQVVWSLLYRHQPPKPNPNVTDALYLAFYVFAIAGLVLLTRARVPRFEFHRWIDGIAIALVVATPGVALVFVPVADHSTGHAFADAVNLAYPLLDILLVGAVLGVFALTNWRPGRSWASLGLGFLLMAIPDSVAAVHRLSGGGATDHGVYHLQSYDFLWTLGLVAIAYAAWAPAPDRVAFERPTGWRAIALPMTAQLLAIATQVFSFFHEIPSGGRPLTLAVLLLGVVQIYMARPLADADEQSADVAESEEVAAEPPTDAETVSGGRSMQ